VIESLVDPPLGRNLRFNVFHLFLRSPGGLNLTGAGVVLKVVGVVVDEPLADVVGNKGGRMDDFIYNWVC
jgi:hypothetical protein